MTTDALKKSWLQYFLVSKPLDLNKYKKYPAENENKGEKPKFPEPKSQAWVGLIECRATKPPTIQIRKTNVQLKNIFIEKL